jgi:hypothetical protein
MIGGQPVAKVRRQQQRLLAITRKFWGMHAMLPTPPDISTGYAGTLRDSL